MAFVEMGPVTNTLMRFMTKSKSDAKPLYTREAPRYATERRALKPIAVAPLNSTEAKERDQLRGMRDALHSDS